MRFAEKVVFVTGAGGRLGREVVQAFAEEGARLICADLTAEAAGAGVELARQAGSEAVVVAGDISSPEDVARMVAEGSQAIGPIDVLATVHGIFPNTPLLEVTAAEWDRPFAINARGNALITQAVARQMVDREARGSIVLVSSGAATSARIGSAAYGGSKAAVNHLVHAAAIELGPYGIRINAVAPGLILDEVLRPDDAHASGYVNMMLQGTPLRRTGAPRDVAEAVLALADERLDWVTGAILEVTGGSHCGRTHVPLSRTLR